MAGSVADVVMVAPVAAPEVHLADPQAAAEAHRGLEGGVRVATYPVRQRPSCSHLGDAET